MAMAAQAKVLSGNKLEQLVVRLQRHSGRPKEACWRFIIQHGIKGTVDLCDVFVTSAIIFANSTTDELETGSLTLEPSIITGQTSEPSTLALLSTGILGLVGAARRKFISRS